MLLKSDFNTILSQRGTLILDGALATELEARGHDLNHALWSGIVLRDHPESIAKVHLDYFNAGADIAITASYQASTQGLCEAFQIDEGEAEKLVRRSVVLAREARERAYGEGVKRVLLVAGSVGPLGAYLADGSEYRGDYSRTKEEFQNFHRPRIRALVNAGADLLAVETMPKLEEIEAVLELLRDEFPTATAWLGCTLKDDRHISDGTSLEDLMTLANAHADRLVAVGVNCVPIDFVEGALKYMWPLTPLPLLCYPNSGEVWDGKEKQWLARETMAARTGDRAKRWHEEGARLIGGCCRTGPGFVGDLEKALFQ